MQIRTGYLVRRKRIRVYWRGSYCWLEVSFGRPGEDLALYFFPYHADRQSWVELVNYKRE